MERATINGTELVFEVRGSGEPVMLMHPGILAGAFAPLLDEEALTGRYLLINYHRRGYAGSTQPEGSVSIAQQAEDCRALMRYLRVERAHLVGHSFGGTIALQLALDAPDSVHSLALLEPIVPGALSDPAQQYFLETVGKAFGLYGAGDKAGAIDTWSRGAFGDEYRGVLDRVSPGAFEQAVADADALFQVEAPALQQWSFTREDAERIKQPVLSVYHEDPVWSGFRETHELLVEWLPQAETFVLPNATHLLQVMNPRGMAEALADFFAGHPLQVRAG
jgi:pimeloyl-ACP methyl ester carboxylesterase